MASVCSCCEVCCITEETRAITALVVVAAIICTIFSLNIAAIASKVSPSVLGTINLIAFSPILIAGLLLVYQNAGESRTSAGRIGSLAILIIGLGIVIPNIIMLSKVSILPPYVTGSITAALMLIAGCTLTYSYCTRTNHYNLY